jgi:hypothetical protein
MGAYPVWFYEKLWGKFPGFTRQNLLKGSNPSDHLKIMMSVRLETVTLSASNRASKKKSPDRSVGVFFICD